MKLLPVPCLLLATLHASVLLQTANAEDHVASTTVSYPRISESGEQLLKWLRQQGGVAHTQVIEVAAGHRVLVTNQDLQPGVDVLVVPPELCIHPLSSHVQTLPLIQDAMPKLLADREPMEANTWAMQTFVMWASQDETSSLLDPYFDSLPTVEDYERQCHWSDLEIAELHLQPFEAGMPVNSPTENVPFPTPSSPGFIWDNDSEWEQWQTTMKRLLLAYGWKSASNAERQQLLQKWNINPEFITDRKRFAWAQMVIGSRAWSGQQLWPVLDMADSNLVDTAVFTIQVNPRAGGRLTAPPTTMTPNGTEVFTVPNSNTNIAFLRSSCHAFENNPHEFVMMDLQLPQFASSDWMNILQSLLRDTRPYENPHPMDGQGGSTRISVYPVQQQPNVIRATIRLFRESTTALLSMARAVVSEGTSSSFIGGGRQPLANIDREKQALEMAEQWLDHRKQKFPTTLEYDRVLYSEISKVPTDENFEALPSAVPREKLRMALIFRIQQKEIIDANLEAIRSMKRHLFQGHDEF